MSNNNITIHQMLQQTSFLKEEEYMRFIYHSLYKESLDVKKSFKNLINLITSSQNIMVAYKKLSETSIAYIKDSDQQNILSISTLTVDKIIEKIQYILYGSPHGYRMKPVDIRYIEKMDGTLKPFSVGGIWDRLIHQCIKQILEPICEAKFSNNSYGSRPIRTYEHALSKVYRLMQRSHLHYVITIKIEDFYNSVGHAKLIRQIWALGIKDKKLIYILKRILSSNKSNCGIFHCGILMSFFTNISLNEFDHWIDKQWQLFPMIYHYAINIDRKSGMPNYGSGYRAMRKTTLKEINLVRYNDDIRIFCKTEDHANRALIGISKWFIKRLNMTVDQSLSCIVNARKKKFEFLGLDIRLLRKGKRPDDTDKYVVKSNISEYQYKKISDMVIRYARNIAKPRKYHTLYQEISTYNNFVTYIHRYFKFATNISVDCSNLQYLALRILYNRLKVKAIAGKGYRLQKRGRSLTYVEKQLYGGYKAMVYEKYTNEPIYPIGCISRVSPIAKRFANSPYDDNVK